MGLERYIKDRFVNLYRGKLKGKEVTLIELKNAIEKVDLYERSYKAGVKEEVIQRQSGLTLGEIQKLPQNRKKVIKRLEKLKGKSRGTKDITSEEVSEILNRDRWYIAKRLLNIDKMRDITKDLGIPNKTGENKRFVNSLVIEGYYVDRIHEYYCIIRDLKDEISLEDFLIKYPQFTSEEDVNNFLTLHHIKFLYPQKSREKMVVG